MKYTVDYFIAKFEAIHDSRWTVGKYTDGVYARCVLGHCGWHSDMRFESPDVDEGHALEKILEPVFGKQMAPAINDGSVVFALELGDTPRERILNALWIVKTKQMELVK